MKKLLIVDDEHHIVNWLASLFESETEPELSILKAYTGTEALNIIETTKVDIILLDIHMPGVSGLTVADTIAKKWAAIRIIFLTGHDEFDYIYYANKHRHIDYLLKTEEDSEILQAVKRAAANLDEEIKTKEIMAQTFANDRLLQYYSQQGYLRDLTVGKNLEDCLTNITWQDGERPDPDRQIILLFGKFALKEQELSTSEHKKMILSLLHLMESSLGYQFHFTFVLYEQDTVLWFLQEKNGFQDNISLSSVLYVKEYLDEMTALWKNLSGDEILLILYYRSLQWRETAKIIPLFTHYSAKILPVPFHHSLAAFLDETIEARLLSAFNTVVLTNSWEVHMNTLSLCLEQGDVKHFLHLLHQLKFEGRQVKSMHHLPLIGIYQRISAMLISYINRHSLTEQLAVKTGLYPLYYLSNFTSWEEAFTFLVTISENIFELGKDNQIDKNQQTVEVIKTYINKHLTEDLSLNSLSNLVNYNSSYVSRLFRQTSGISLFEYITQCRINKAKEYLCQSDLTMNAIAKKTGFDTPQYFSIVFRKATGMTPKKYRSQCE